MTSLEAKGSFMRVEHVLEYFRDKFNFEGWWNMDVEIDDNTYFPIEVIKEKFIGETAWKTMQTKITTHVFGLEPIELEEREVWLDQDYSNSLPD